MLPRRYLTSLGIAKASRLRQSADVIHSVLDMAAPYAKGFSTAYKRARSQESSTPLASPPVLKATKVEEEEAEDDFEIPAFLRQSQAGESFIIVHTQACIMPLTYSGH